MEGGHIVYMLVNDVDGKVYVGKTSKTLDKRWDVHVQHSRSVNRHKQYITRAISKHGPDAFSRRVLETCGSNEDACESERRWIDATRARDPRVGYNLTSGGEGTPGRVVSDATRMKLRARRVSDETRQKMSAAALEVHRRPPSQAMLVARREHAERMSGAGNPAYGKDWGRKGPLSLAAREKLSAARRGKKLTLEHRERISAGQRGRRGPNTGTCRPIAVYDDGGRHVATMRNFDAVATWLSIDVKALRKRAAAGHPVVGFTLVKGQRCSIEQAQLFVCDDMRASYGLPT